MSFLSPLELSLSYEGTAKDHTDMKKASNKKRPKQTEVRGTKSNARNRRACQRNDNILEEVTDVVSHEKGTRCYNMGTMNKSS